MTINGQTHYLWRAVDHEGKVLECYVTKTRAKASALKSLKTAMKRYGNPQEVVTDRLSSYGAAISAQGSDGLTLDVTKCQKHLRIGVS